ARAAAGVHEPLGSLVIHGMELLVRSLPVSKARKMDDAIHPLKLAGPVRFWSDVRDGNVLRCARPPLSSRFDHSMAARLQGRNQMTSHEAGCACHENFCHAFHPEGR